MVIFHQEMKHLYLIFSWGDGQEMAAAYAVVRGRNGTS